MDIDEPQAGPSTLSPTTAPERPLPPTHFYSVEYPGYVQPTSVPLALERLGGAHAVETAFGPRASGKEQALLELRFRPGQPFAHPVPGEVVPTNNIVLRVVKRRRKDGQGEYTADAVGVVPKTARFRSMVDYQYTPDMTDPVSNLRLAMDNMDVEGILRYHIPLEKEDYTVSEDDTAMDVDIDPQLLEQGATTRNKTRSNLRLFPPPLFSRQVVPQNYNYKPNTASVETIVVDEDTGKAMKRLVNNMRWKGYGPISISFTGQVPDKPSSAVEGQRGAADQRLLKRLQELFAERPIFTRAAIFNQFSPFEVREIINSKFLLPLVSYVFEDGPWRDTQVRLGYDPRTDPAARIYQRLYFRNGNHPVGRPSVLQKRQESRNEYANRVTETVRSSDERRSHIFDGETITKETAAFQLCDITDPMLRELIEDEESLRETCHERDGWYTESQLDRIKLVLRHKFFSLLHGHVPNREECEKLLIVEEGSNKLQPPTKAKLKFGKHNMAKGALPPEDAAAYRLMTAIEGQRKTFPRP